MQEVAGFHDPCHLIESWSRTVYKTVGLIWRWNRANPQVSAKDTEANLGSRVHGCVTGL